MSARMLDPVILGDEESRKFTIAWICPTAPEWIAAEAALSVDTARSQKPFAFSRPHDQSHYVGGRIGCRWVVLGRHQEMGQRAALDLARSMDRSFPCIGDFLVVGIAGGMSSYPFGGHGQLVQPIVLGDVVISSQRPNGPIPGIQRVDFGRDTEEGVQPGYKNCTPSSSSFKAALNTFQQRGGTGSMGNPQSVLHPDEVFKIQACVRRNQKNERLATDPGADRDYLISASWEHPNNNETCEDACVGYCTPRSARGVGARRETNSPIVHLGPVASMDSFLANPCKRDHLSAKGYLCVEMEAASVAEEFPTTTIRGLMDYCDTHRHYSAGWREYASVTAAATARYLISKMTPSQSREIDTVPAVTADSKKRNLVSLQHYLDDMPALSRHYQPQPEINYAIQKVCTSSNEHESSKLLLHGLAGRGKTQSCVKLMESAEKSASRRWSHLLWVNAHSPEALFDSLLTLQDDFGVPKLKAMQSRPSTSSRISNAAKSLAKDIERWLSGQESSWLMVLDNLVLDGDTDANDDLRFGDMQVMFLTLLKAKRGVVIITAREIPDGWAEYGNTMTRAVTSMDKASALKLVSSHFPDKEFTSSEMDNALKLCYYLDYLPLGLSIFCCLIAKLKVSIESSLRHWQDVFNVQPNFTLSPAKSLDFSFQESYRFLKNKKEEPGGLRAVDLFNILACFDGTRISETIFQRAWESSSTKKELPVSRRRLNMLRILGVDTQESQTDIREATSLVQSFMRRAPHDVQWAGSSAQKQLRSFLSTLENLSFLRFSDDPNRCDIRIPSILQAWVRKHFCASTVSEIQKYRHAWRQASFILATSLASSTSDKGSVYRSSRAFLAFQRRAAVHIEQLRHLSDGLNPAAPNSLMEEQAFVIWTRDFPDFSGTSTASLFADALDAHDYETSSLLLRKEASFDGNDLNALAQHLVYADSLERNCHHEQALQSRDTAKLSIQKIEFPEVLIGSPSTSASSSARQIELKKQLELVVDFDIAKSKARLGRVEEASKILERVVGDLEAVQEAWGKANDDQYRINDPFCIFISQARIEWAKCSLRQNHQYQQAQGLIDDVLCDIKLKSRDSVERRKIHFDAKAVRADIMYACGQHEEARRERSIIHRHQKHLDPKMKSIDTLVAKERYANSWSAVGDYKSSLALRKEIEDRLLAVVPRGHDFIHQFQQNLARFKLELADEEYYNKRRREHDEKGQELIASAVELSQQAWRTRREAQGWGLTRPETLDTLALMIAGERVLRGFRKFPETHFISEAAIKETAAVISRCPTRESTDVRSAWYRVQLESCLIVDLNRRMKKLQSLNDRLSHAGDMDVVQEAKLEVHFHIAKAKMEPLHWINDRHERYAQKREPKFKDAAEALDDVWSKQEKRSGPKSAASLRYLAAVVEAYGAIDDERYWHRAKYWCLLLNEMYGEGNTRAGEALKGLIRRRNGYRPKDTDVQEDISWLKLRNMENGEFEAWVYWSVTVNEAKHP